VSFLFDTWVLREYFRCQKVSDELLEKKIEFGREMALSSQQNEFLIKRIDEFQRQNETFLSHYEEKLSNFH